MLLVYRKNAVGFKSIYLQGGVETIRGKDSWMGDVLQTAKKRKKGDAGKVSVTKRLKREDEEQRKALFSKHKGCDETDRVSNS